MGKNTQITLPFARSSSKKVIPDFDGGSLTSDADVMLLREVEKGIGLIKRLTDVLKDDRLVTVSNPTISVSFHTAPLLCFTTPWQKKVPKAHSGFRLSLTPFKNVF
ncbi:MAG: transposase [Gemmatimonadota bacterium]|nr:MAG: transposase [Gemmatimonadota bacterium]